MLVNLLCNLHKMDLRVIQTTVVVVLLDQSDFHLCGTTQCDNYVVMAMAYYWNKCRGVARNFKRGFPLMVE